MDIESLVRDPDYVFSTLRELEDNSLVATKETRIYFPARFVEQGLASIDIETNVIGIFAIVVDGKYSVFSVNAMIRFDPVEITTLMIGGEENYEMLFTPGATIIPNLNVAAVDTLVYRIYNEFVAKGRVPWYMTYDKDMPRIFDTAPEYAGAGIGREREVTELLMSIIGRNPDNLNQSYRLVAGQGYKPPRYISLKTVEYSATNALNKLGGANFTRGTIGALVSPSVVPERIETLLRI